MSFMCRKLIIRSQKWVKHSALLFNELINRGTLSQFSSVAYVWGAGDGGQLGTGNQDCSLVPIKLPVLCEVSHVGCGYGFTVAAEANSCNLWTTGLNSFSQLGRKLQDSNEQDGSAPATADPYLTSTLSARVQDISCGRSHSAVLMDDGKVLTCGGNYHGQCGVGNKNTRSIEKFTQIQSVVGKIIQIACGSDHTLLLSDEGKVVSCGWGADGQTGLGHFKDETTFTLLQGELKNVRIKQIATSADCCLALSDEGEVFSWGNNEYGQLAIDSEEEQFSVPTRASLLNNLPGIAQVAAGGAFCVVLTVTGELYSWGYGVLGQGPGVNFSKTPRKIQDFPNIDGTITRVICGPDNTAVITDSGALYTWGRGSFGRLGLGSIHDQWIPKKVELPGEVVEVSCGVDHMAAVVKCR